MGESLTHFEIRGLHGHLDFKIDITDNTLILVGENGSGKTSVLRILYHLLAGQLSSLTQYQFNTLKLCIDNQCVKISGSQFKELIPKENLRFIERNFPPPIRAKLKYIISKVNSGDASREEIEHYCERYDIPPHILYNSYQVDLFSGETQKNKSSLRNEVEELRKTFNSHVLYLPTYRRIEQDLDRIFRGMDIDEFRLMRRHPRRSLEESIELVEFGMNDVQESIDKTLEQLKEFSRDRLNKLTLGYLGDVVDEKYNKINVKTIQKTEDNTINAVLGRIQESILSTEQKKHLRETIDHVRKDNQSESPTYHHKVICHYLLTLLKFQEELQAKEKRINDFAEICTRYFSSNKECSYDSTTFTFHVKLKLSHGKSQELKIKHLSSGEKQIMSLFSHLYLSEKKNFFVLIDEPELSLSVPWQRQFLVDIWNSNFCNGLVAVTHSPFIYENKLKPYAHGLGEFSV